MRHLWLYALADAQRVTGVAIHHGVLMVNHHHITVTPSVNNLPDFLHRVHRDLSSAVMRLLRDSGLPVATQLWDSAPAHQSRLLDAAEQARWLVYEHNNPVDAGLVDSPEEMPDHAFGFGLWQTGFIDVERPPLYFGQQRPRVLRLTVTPPPLLWRDTGGDTAALVHDMRRASNEQARAILRGRSFPALGAQGVARIDPNSEPSRNSEQRSRTARHSLEARHLRATERRTRVHAELNHFRQSHRQARVERSHRRDAVFPFGTYLLSKIDKVATEAAPPPGALVTEPGPTLAAVKRELRARSVASTPSFSVRDAVGRALEGARADGRRLREAGEPRLDPVRGELPHRDTGSPPRTSSHAAAQGCVVLPATPYASRDPRGGAVGKKVPATARGSRFARPP